jgi:hypothetical protein
VFLYGKTIDVILSTSKSVLSMHPVPPEQSRRQQHQQPPSSWLSYSYRRHSPHHSPWCSSTYSTIESHRHSYHPLTLSPTLLPNNLTSLRSKCSSCAKIKLIRKFIHQSFSTYCSVFKIGQNV